MVQKTKHTIRQWRGLRELTQQELAEKSGVHSRSIQFYETDVKNLRSASYETVEAIAKALGVTIDEIFLDEIS